MAAVTAGIYHCGMSGKPVRDRDVARAKRAKLRRAALGVRRAHRVQLVAQVMAGMAHDLNNLLAAIVMNSEYALARVRDDGALRAAVEDIHQGAACAAGLTRQLLAIGRGEPAEAPAADLNEIVRGLEPLVRRAMGARIRTVVELAPDAGPLDVDATQIAQVVLNLAVNARDAMPDGGELTISTGTVDAREGGKAARRVLLRVRDTGHGMDPATQARMFEPFFSTKGPERGTGLGLTAVADIVRRAGGRIAVESAPGSGTAFDIVLPRRSS